MGGELGSLVAARLEECDWVGSITGFGMHGYELAVSAVARRLG